MKITLRQAVESQGALGKCCNQVSLFSVTDLLRLGRVLKAVKSELENYQQVMAQLRQKNGTYNEMIDEGQDKSFYSFTPDQTNRLEADHLFLLKEEIEVPLKEKFAYSVFEKLIDPKKKQKDDKIDQLTVAEVAVLDWLIDFPGVDDDESPTV